MPTPYAENTDLNVIAHAEIKVEKAFHGWRAQTMVHIARGKTLDIVTMKRSSGALATTIIRGHYSPPRNPGGFEGFEYEPFNTYNMTPLAVSGIRVTAKAVGEQHRKVLADLKRHIDAANNFKG